MVQLIQVDVIRAQSSQTFLHRPHQVFTGEGAVDLGGQDHLVPTSPVGQPPAQHSFRASIRIGRRGVEEIDATFFRPIQNGKGRFLIDLPPERDTTHADRTDIEPGDAQRAKFQIHEPGFCMTANPSRAVQVSGSF